MRNVGKSQHRFKQNPLEEIFAIGWERLNTSDHGHNTTLDYLLAENPNSPCGEVSERDREVAATVVQWLGSHVGQFFLKDIINAAEEQRIWEPRY